MTWKKSNYQPRKIAYGMSISTVKKVIKDHQKRGWHQASEIKPHGYGYGCLLIFDIRGEENVNDPKG